MAVCLVLSVNRSRLCMKTASVFLIGLTYFLSACTASSIPAPVENVVVEQSVILEEPEPIVVRPDKYIIKSGETLHEIALNYGLEYQKIALWNGLDDPDRIYAGQVLLLKPPNNEPKVSVVGKKAVVEEKVVTLPAASTVISEYDEGGDKNSAALPVNVPVKKSPLAAKYIYSPQTLKKLTSQWRANREKKTPTPKPAPKEQSAAAKNIADSHARRRFDIDWIWPVKGKIENKFNERNKGINIIAQLGSPVSASADGKVVYVGSGVKSYGRLVIIKHQNDYLSAYAHNQKILVREGQVIKRGQQVATLGDSGATKPMLHFEVRKSGKPFDPLQVLPAKQ